MTISVCMATFQGERYVAEQIESILPQLAQQDELVISDDSSTDRTPSIIARYAAADQRIRFFPGQRFRSPVLNFEFVLRQAQGDLVVLSDQDDIWLPHKLETVRSLFAEEDRRPFLVVLDGEIMDGEGRTIHPSVLSKLNAGRGFWKNLFDNRYLGCCMAFSRDLLHRALPFPRRIPMHDIWLGQLCERIGTTRFVPKVTMRYRRHEGTLTDFRIRFRPILQIQRRLILAWNLISRAYLS